MDWFEIAGIVVVGLLGVWGGLKAWRHIPKEIGEALVALADYLEEPNPSEEKRQKLLKEFADVLNLVRKVF